MNDLSCNLKTNIDYKHRYYILPFLRHMVDFFFGQAFTEMKKKLFFCGS